MFTVTSVVDRVAEPSHFGGSGSRTPKNRWLQLLRLHGLGSGSTMLESKDVPDIEFAGYPACRISGDSKSRILDIRPDIRLQPDTGYPAKLNIQNCFVQNCSDFF